MEAPPPISLTRLQVGGGEAVGAVHRGGAGVGGQEQLQVRGEEKDGAAGERQDYRMLGRLGEGTKVELGKEKRGGGEVEPGQGGG